MNQISSGDAVAPVVNQTMRVGPPALDSAVRATDPDTVAGSTGPESRARATTPDPAVRATGSGTRTDSTGPSASPSASSPASASASRAATPVSDRLAALAQRIGAPSSAVSLADLAARAAAVARLVGPFDLGRLAAAASMDPVVARALAGTLLPGEAAALAADPGDLPVAAGGRDAVNAAGRAAGASAAPSPALAGGTAALPYGALARCVLRFLDQTAVGQAAVRVPAGRTGAETPDATLRGALGMEGHRTGTGGEGVTDGRAAVRELALELVRRAFGGSTAADAAARGPDLAAGDDALEPGSPGRRSPATAGTSFPAGTQPAPPDAAGGDTAMTDPSRSGIPGGNRSAGGGGGSNPAGAQTTTSHPLIPGAEPGDLLAPPGAAAPAARDTSQAAASPGAPPDPRQALLALLGDQSADADGRLARLLENLAHLDPTATAANLARRAAVDTLVADALRRLVDAGPGRVGAAPSDSSSLGASPGPGAPGLGMVPDADDALLLTNGSRALGIDLGERDPRLLVPLLGLFASLAGATDPAELVERASRDRRARRRLRRSLSGSPDGFADGSGPLAASIDDAAPHLPPATTRRLRIWNAACGDGVDAYGIAIAALERGLAVGPEVLATDAADDAIVEARRGRYPARYVDQLSPDSRARFFTDVGDSVEVVADVRRLVTFRRHDLGAASIGDRFDIVICRGTLWALSEAARERAAAHLVEGVRVGGILVLGDEDPAIGPESGVLPLGNARYLRVADSGQTVNLEA